MSPTGATLLQRKPSCACGGGCPRCSHEQFIQPKLIVSTPGDRYEQEADRVAEHVMLTTHTSDKHDAPATGHDNNSIGTHIQAKESGGRQIGIGGVALTAIDAARAGGGQPLPSSVRGFMEPRFGHDFGHVRVHADARAAESAQALGARAYTLGSDVVFGAGEYRPETAAGRLLLAHELAHVIQQGQPGASRTTTIARQPAAQPAAQPADAQPAAAPGAKSDFREALLSGTIKSEKDYGFYDLTPKFQFRNAKLQQAYEYVQTKYKLGVEAPAAAVEESKDKKAAPQQQGDSLSKDPDDVPQWVRKLVQALIETGPNAPGLDPYKHHVPAGPYAGVTWTEDSTLAQHVVEAFYYGWHARLVRSQTTPGAATTATAADAQAGVPANVGELFAHVGASKTNKRAQIIGETPQAIYGWCGPASQFSLAISLMRRGFRFKTGRPPLEPKKRKPPQIPQLPDKDPEPYRGYNKRAAELRQMQEEQNVKNDQFNEWVEADAVRMEIIKQGAYFLDTWSKAQLNKFGVKKDKSLPDRIVGGAAAHTAPLEPGDYLTVIMANSPLSGHVATVIKEERYESDKPGGFEPGDAIGKIYFVSGNVRNSAVRVEVVERELPLPTYDWGETSKIGNRYTDLKQAEKDAMAKLNRAAGTGNLQQQLLSKLSTNKEMRAKAVKQAPSGFILFIQNNWGQPGKILPFFAIAGMNPAGYLDALNRPERAALEKATEKKVEYKEKYREKGIPVDHHDPSYHTMNRDAKSPRADGKPVGKLKPLDPNHAWVVSIVKSSLLDAKRIEADIAQASATQASADASPDAQAEDPGLKVLDKQGLEKLTPEWQELFEKAMNYWEPRGGFR
ncbi:MAG TPA: DUF4157 domain-containing protein [Pyrinomonadaceae bacterium]|nr:DUF4157 domain-containing protein [Pyrinomonadaceae bacterium]